VRRRAASRSLVIAAILAGCAAPSSTPGSTPSESPAAPTDSPTATARPSATDAAASSTPEAELSFEMTTYPVPPGAHPHDVAPAADGGIWYTGQGNGTLGWLDPASGEVREIPLGPGSAPHGVITGPDGAAWVTDGGLNAIVRVDPDTDEVTTYPLDVPNANLNTATFDGDGVLWFTGQAGVHGRLHPASGQLTTYASPIGPGPYGIATTPDGEVWLGSLGNSYLGAVDRDSGEVTVIDTPTARGGARRVWSDSGGRLYVTEWFAGRLARYDPADASWSEWPLPGETPMPYAVYVDELDAVWVTDFGSNALLRFDPETEEWQSFAHESQPAEVRQLLGRDGEVWGAESAADQLVVVRYGR
jgi:virginiamycin B lyase